MKKKTVKTYKFFSAIIIFLFNSALFANDFHLSIQPEVTYHLGQQDEFVYLAYDGQEKRTLSELNWEQNSLFMPGIKVKGQVKNAFVVLGAKTAIPSSCGTVYDSDWLNISENLGCSDYYAGIKTNYSESDCILDSFYQLSVKAGYKAQINSCITFYPFAELDYSYSSYYANGGWALYSSNSRDGDGYLHSYTDSNYSYYYSFSGNVMQLERITYFTWLGGELSADLSPKISLAFSFALSPFLYVQSLDSHILKNSYYLDEMLGFLKGTREEASLTINFTKNTSLVFSVQGYILDNIYGSAKQSNKKNASYSEYYDSSYTANGKSVDISSGSSFYSLDFTIAYSFKLL